MNKQVLFNSKVSLTVLFGLLLAARVSAQDPQKLIPAEHKPKPAAVKVESHAQSHAVKPSAHKASHSVPHQSSHAPQNSDNASAPAVRHAGGASTESIRAYCSAVWNKLQNNWQLADGNNHVTLTAPISSDGSLGDISVESSPKNSDAEAAAMSALERSKPLNLLPSGMNAGKIKIIFDSKADPHGDSSSGGSVRLDPVNQ